MHLKLAAAAAALAATTACFFPVEPEQCTFGASPFDGESAVEGNRVVELRSGRPLPRDLPPLDAAFDVFTARGRAIPVDVDLSPDRRRVTLTPRQGWPPDTDVHVSGPHWTRLDETPHWSDDPPEQGWAADLVFHTGPELHVRRMVLAGDDVVRLATSEPLDLATLDGRVRLADDHVGEFDFEVLGTVEGLPHVVELSLPDGVEREVQRVFVSRGVTARSGSQLPADVVLRADFGEERPLDGLDGEPTCALRVSL